MKAAINITLWLIRLLGLLLIILGVLFWTGHATNLIPEHMILGGIFVLALWTLCGVALRSPAKKGLVYIAMVWGALILMVGAAQLQLPGGIFGTGIRIVHLLMGLMGMGFAEMIGGRAKR